MMRCLVFTLALTFAGCATYSQIGSGDSRDASALSGPGMTVTWFDSRGGYPSVGYYDVQTVFSTKELGNGPYVRVAALHITGTSPKDLLGMLRMQASRIGANRLLIVKAEEKIEEVYLYSGLENVAGFFSGEKMAADRRDEAYTLRIEAIAIRMTVDRTTLEPSRQWNDRPTVYQPRRPYDRPTVYRPRRPDDRRNVKPPRRPDDRRNVKPPRRPDDRRNVKPPPPREEPAPVKPPPPKDDQPAEKPPPPKDDRPNLKPPGLKTKTHRP
ncbi:MAG: hypothetical protein OXD39_08630 [Gemmatimonadetes bacterium]|nr:hypothetical protein [Gemmatimonadota bacterium]